MSFVSPDSKARDLSQRFAAVVIGQTSRCVRLLLRGLPAIEAGATATAEELLHDAAREQGRFADALIMGDARMLLASALLRAGQTSAALEPLTAALDDHVRRGTPGVLLLGDG